MTTLQQWFGGRQSEIWMLEKDQTTRLDGVRPVVIEVVEGLLLVTREGDVADHILKSGDVLALAGRGRVAAWALEPTRAVVRDARLDAAGAAAIRHSPARA